MKHLKLYTFFVFLIFSACGVDWSKHKTDIEPTVRAYNLLNFPNISIGDEYFSFAEPGKCYVQCYYIDALPSDTIKIFEYTGTDYNSNGVYEKTIALTPKLFSYKKMGIGSRIKELTEITEAYYVVKDTTINKAFKTIKIPVKEISMYEVTNDCWVEELCENDANGNIAEIVNRELIRLGYLNENALHDYQETNGLPISGTLNVPTLEHLNLRYLLDIGSKFSK